MKMGGRAWVVVRHAFQLRIAWLMSGMVPLAIGLVIWARWDRIGAVEIRNGTSSKLVIDWTPEANHPSVPLMPGRSMTIEKNEFGSPSIRICRLDSTDEGSEQARAECLHLSFTFAFFGSETYLVPPRRRLPWFDLVRPFEVTEFRDEKITFRNW